MDANRRHMAEWAARLRSAAKDRVEAIQPRLEDAWGRQDEDCPPMAFPYSDDLPLTDRLSRETDEADAEWVPVRSILGDGGDGDGWGAFTYRPDACQELVGHFLRDVDSLRKYPVQGVRVETNFGPIYWVTVDGLHRLAAAKGVGLPYLPFECVEVYETAGLLRAGLDWSSPRLAEVPDRSRWSSLLRAGGTAGASAVHRRRVKGWERVALWRILLETGHLHGDLARMEVFGEDSVVLRLDPSSPRPWLLRELQFLRKALGDAYSLSLPDMAGLDLPPLPRKREEALEGIPRREVYQVLRLPDHAYLSSPGTRDWTEVPSPLPTDTRFVVRQGDALAEWRSSWLGRGDV